MPKAVDLTGQKFGKLKVLEMAGRINFNAYYYCECDCGTWTLTRGAELKNGKTKTCGGKGCRSVGRENPNFRHGGRMNGQSLEYRAWMYLKDKGLIPTEWKTFQQFFKDVGWKPSPQHQLARHDIRKPHGPTNTYWRNPIEERIERAGLGLPDDTAIDMSSILSDSFTRITATA